MFCRQCGHEVESRDKICSYCGANIQPEVSSFRKEVPVDEGSFGWAILGFFVPIIGLILFIIWRDEKPKSSKQAGVGALVSVILNVVMVIIIVICVVLVAGMDDANYKAVTSVLIG